MLIRPAEPSDAPLLTETRNNQDTFIHLHNAELVGVRQTQHWLQNLPPSSQRFIVTDKKFQHSSGKHQEYYIGIIRLDQIDPFNKSVQVGLDILPEARGKGWSYKIYNWLFDYLFNQQGFHCLYLEVLETNNRAIHIYEKLGFLYDGKIRQKVFRNGEFINSIIMTLLSHEWRKKNESQDIKGECTTSSS